MKMKIFAKKKIRSKSRRLVYPFFSLHITCHHSLTHSCLSIRIRNSHQIFAILIFPFLCCIMSFSSSACSCMPHRHIAPNWSAFTWNNHTCIVLAMNGKISMDFWWNVFVWLFRFDRDWSNIYWETRGD